MTLKWTRDPEQRARWTSIQMKVDDGRSRVILPQELKRHGYDPGLWYLKEHVGNNFLAEDAAVIHAPFEIGDNVHIGFNVTIYPNCKIGDNVKIESGCTVLESTTIESGKTWTKHDELTSLLKQSAG